MLVEMTEPAEEITDEQIRELHAALGGLREELEAVLALSRDGSKPVALDHGATGRVSRVDALQQQQMALANRRSAEVRLAQVRRALASHEAGDYGYCAECEEPIGYRRLRSRPEAPFCLPCQAQRESK